MNNVVIVDVFVHLWAAQNGVFRHKRAEGLSARLMKGLLERNPAVDPASMTTSAGVTYSGNQTRL